MFSYAVLRRAIFDPPMKDGELRRKGYSTMRLTHVLAHQFVTNGKLRSILTQPLRYTLDLQVNRV